MPTLHPSSPSSPYPSTIKEMHLAPVRIDGAPKPWEATKGARVLASGIPEAWLVLRRSEIQDGSLMVRESKGEVIQDEIKNMHEYSMDKPMPTLHPSSPSSPYPSTIKEMHLAPVRIDGAPKPWEATKGARVLASGIPEAWLVLRRSEIQDGVRNQSQKIKTTERNISSD
ncbi:hypothetical protein COCNU_scaffold000963G000010 [Cocos nucifera]|nr:hypothetical protein [Cocos nucifera]